MTSCSTYHGPNYAAWMREPHQQLEVDKAPLRQPGEGEVLVQVSAVSVQPIDWKIQQGDYDDYITTYPWVLGTDAAGTIVEVGAGVTSVKKGDRVLAHSLSIGSADPKQSAFQHFALMRQETVAVIPESLTFESASVLPLALSTAAAGLYQKNYLGLPYPHAEGPNPDGRGKVIVVFGGSSSVGITAVQLARASGVRVVATSSPANFELVKAAGASAVFDYRSPSIVAELVREVERGAAVDQFAGAYDAISSATSMAQCAEVASRVKAGLRFVATVLPPPRDVPDGVICSYLVALDVVRKEGGAIAKAIYTHYVPAALANGSLVARPEPLVVGRGLAALQGALEVQKRGVSARKVVVSLP